MTESQGAWRRSTRCCSGACVEVRPAGSAIEMRDSKDPDGATLVFTRAEWIAFVEGVQAGEFDF